MKIKKQPSRKRSKALQSQVTEARGKMKQQVVQSKKIYKRKPKHKSHDEK